MAVALEETAAEVGLNRHDTNIPLENNLEYTLCLVGPVARIDLFNISSYRRPAFNLGMCAAGKNYHLEFRVFVQNVLEPGTAMRGHAEMSDLPGLVQPLESLYQGFNFRIGVELIGIETSRHLGLGPPDVEIISLEQAQAFFNVMCLVLNVTSIRPARTEVVDIGSDVHLVAPPLQGRPITQTFSSRGNVQVVDADVDAGADDVGAVPGNIVGHLLVGEMIPVPAGVTILPVAAQADL